MRKIFLIGQAPSKTGDPRKPLLGGRPAQLIMRLAEMTPTEYLQKFHRVNLLNRWPGKTGKGDAFPLGAARVAAENLSPRLRGQTVVFLGQGVASAFDFPTTSVLRWFSWFGGGRAAILPHPSGINRWWNSSLNMKQAARFMKRLLSQEKTMVPKNANNETSRFKNNPLPHARKWKKLLPRELVIAQSDPLCITIKYLLADKFEKALNALVSRDFEGEGVVAKRMHAYVLQICPEFFEYYSQLFEKRGDAKHTLFTGSIYRGKFYKEIVRPRSVEHECTDRVFYEWVHNLFYDYDKKNRIGKPVLSSRHPYMKPEFREPYGPEKLSFRARIKSLNKSLSKEKELRPAASFMIIGAGYLEHLKRRNKNPVRRLL
jgi:hypothetical protein